MVNNCIMHVSEYNLPFGGVNNSGMGRYHGVHGFRELSHERAVLHTP
jgi:aldehyde dehydrogenase (NAD+)